MTLLRTKGCATSSVLTHQLIFASHEGQTTCWANIHWYYRPRTNENRGILFFMNLAMKVGQQAKGPDFFY